MKNTTLSTKYFVLIFINLFFFTQLNAQVKSVVIDGKKYQLELIHQAKDVIWGFDFLSNQSSDEIIFSLRGGQLYWLNQKLKSNQVIKGVPAVVDEGQGGLLDVFIHPQSKNIYLTFSQKISQGVTTSLFRGALSTTKNELLQGQVIFQADAAESTRIHFGSRLAYDGKNYLFMTVGDRNVREKSQDSKSHHGKILRLDLSQIENAKVTQSDGRRAQVKVDIWSLGHRNPQGIVFDDQGRLFEVEFGPRGGDELNLIVKDLNYGWPIVTHGREYYGPKIGVPTKSGFTDPITYWVPSISPSGMAFYKGDFYLANLSGEHIRRLKISNDKSKPQVLQQDVLLDDLGERFRHIKAGPDGALYFSTDSGKLYKLY